MDKVLLVVASTFEGITGAALLIAPTTIKLLLGMDVSGPALALARVGGFDLLLLGIACWPRVEATVPRLLAMVIYNVFLGYLRFGSESVGLLWLPTIAVHAVLAILFMGVWSKHLTT